MNEALSRFKELSPVAQAAIVGVTAWNLWLIFTAQRDLQHRPHDEVRGPKLLWRLACITNTVGPLVYFRWGRNQ